MNRRETLTGIAALALDPGLRAESGDPPYNAAGERVGEVTATSAIVHARLTAAPARNNRGYSFPVHTHNLSTMNQLRQIRMPDKMRLSELEGSCEGKGGRARLRYAVDREYQEVETRCDINLRIQPPDRQIRRGHGADQILLR